MVIPVTIIHWFFFLLVHWDITAFRSVIAEKQLLTDSDNVFILICEMQPLFTHEPTIKTLKFVNHLMATFFLGYQGNGVTCTWVGLCNINNGGCHSLATCQESPGLALH